MRISIAMATYNGAKYLPAQLESLTNQTDLPFELVVCDDGSTDETLSIIREFAKLAPFAVRIYQNAENLHYTGNFIKAASLCVGDAIAFCDQDDIWDSRKIETCKSALQAGPTDLVIHEGRVIDSVGQPTHVKIPNLSEDYGSLNRTPFNRVAVGFAMVFRRKVIEELIMYWNWDEYVNLKSRHGVPLGHDLFVYAWCFNRRTIVFLQKELVRYRVHGKNQTLSLDITKSRVSRFVASFNNLAMEKSIYQRSGDKWAAEVAFLSSYMRRSKQDPPLQGLSQLSDWYSLKSKLWLDRAGIYDRHSPRKERWKRLIRLLFSGGYLSNKTPRLGLKSMGKDLMIAVFY